VKRAEQKWRRERTAPSSQRKWINGNDFTSHLPAATPAIERIAPGRPVVGHIIGVRADSELIAG
jgi:hypothetical protein